MIHVYPNMLGHTTSQRVSKFYRKHAPRPPPPPPHPKGLCWLTTYHACLASAIQFSQPLILIIHPSLFLMTTQVYYWSI